MPLADAPRAALAGVHGVLTDIDDTLTRDGIIEPGARDALQQLAAAGLPVVAITGRPMGWSEPFVRDGTLPVIVAEKGAGAWYRDGMRLCEAYVQDPLVHGKVSFQMGKNAFALGEALHGLLELEAIKPLGSWLDDEVILAVCERYRDNMRAAADFLQTKPRNIGRWMPKVLSRDHERSASSLWQTPHRLIRQWIREAAVMDEPPQVLVQRVLLSHVLRQCEGISVADRARIMGVSVPTYQKRLQDMPNQ